MDKEVDFRKCCAVSGFNTKQVWVYTEEHDAYIDPPASVLKEIDNQVDDWWDFSKKEDLLDEIIKKDPDWLQDIEYRYSADDFEI